MFERLYKLIDNISKLDKQKIFLSIFSDKGVQEYIISLNITEQFFIDGVGAAGQELGSYSEVTANLKSGYAYVANRLSINDEGFITSEEISKTIQEGDSYILYDTGKFHSDFKVEVFGDEFLIESNTKKINKFGKRKGRVVDIEKEYGKLVGLNEKSKTELVEAILPIVIRKVRNSIISETPDDLFV